MGIKFKAARLLTAGTMGIGIFAGKSGRKTLLPQCLVHKLDTALYDLVKQQPELLEKNKSTSLVVYDNSAGSRINLFGFGDIKELTADSLRQLGGESVRALSSMKSFSPHLVFPADFFKEEGSLRAFIEGMILGAYIFDEYKSKKEKTPDMTVTFITDNTRGLTAQIKQAEIVADSVNFARNLINRPGNAVTPAVLLTEAQEIAKKTGLSFKALDTQEMKKLGMGALLSVAQGSEQPPYMIILEYKGAPTKKEKMAFVGKGITFDSGGISLKPSDGMGEMKDDMGGAAAVLAALHAVARLKLPCNVVGIIPAAENMPSGKAARPGDIVKAASGKTIEIISTDAEGRMLLADAVWYAGAKAGASQIVDMATLTGAASIALGETVAGVVGNNDKLSGLVIKASTNSGEKCWLMPTFEEFKEYNKSDVADIKNSGGRYGGMITGGLFIGEFAEKPWVHIDIGNTVTSKTTKGYNVKGPSGFGVRLLIEVARSL